MLRIAVLLNQQRLLNLDFEPELTLVDQTLLLTLDRDWIAQRPLMRAELAREAKQLANLDITFEVARD